jgi:hypothetical protein
LVSDIPIGDGNIGTLFLRCDLCVQGSELAYLYGILLIVVFPLLTGLFGYFAIKYSNSKRREVRAPRANQIAKKR